MIAKYNNEQQASLSEYSIMVDGCRMHYRAAGTGQQAVVLVHGLTVSGKYLLPTARELLDDYTVYVPDVPGFGTSETPRRVLEIVEMADVLKAWMDAIGLDQVYLLGNSLGCHTVTVFAARYGERVAGIILVSPVGDPGGRNVLRLAIRALNDFVREPLSFWVVMVQDFLKVGVRRTVLTLRNMLKCRLDLWLPQVDGPALVVSGGRDRIVPKSWIGRVTALLPQGRAAVIREAGHVPNFSHPARLAALVRSFADSSDKTGK